MSFKLNIKPDNDNILEYYVTHKHFHEGDSGIDLFCPEEMTIQPGETATINFGIKCEANSGYYLYPRSSISKTPLRMANSVGIIDMGYRGNIMAKVDNIKNIPYTINKGSRLFQIVSPSLLSIKLQIVDSLTETTRGESGFGSTGINS